MSKLQELFLDTIFVKIFTNIYLPTDIENDVIIQNKIDNLIKFYKKRVES